MMNHISRRRRVSAAAIAATLGLAATLTACGPAEGGGGDGSAGEVGGTLRVAIPGPISGFDPLTISGGIDDAVAESSVYDTLMTFSEVGAEPGPMLALSATPNDDFTEWTVELRTGVTFTDGTPFNAEAVKFNFDRQLDPDNGASAAAIMTPLESVEVVDDDTVLFTTKFPWPNLPYLLTFPPAIMASPAAIEEFGDDYANNPVGTGPYILESQVPGSEYILTRNPDYWNAENAGFAERIEFTVISNAASALQTLQTGGIDVIAQAGADTIVQASASADLTVSQCLPTVATGGILNFNIGQAPFDDPRVRLALNHAIDREAIAEGLNQGLVGPSAGPFAGSRWDTGVEYPQFDLDEAQRLMDEYLADGGSPVTVTLTTTAGNPLAPVVQDMWNEIGVTTEIAEVDVPTLIGGLIQKQFQVMTFSSSIYPNPDFVFYAFNSSTSPLNLSGVGDPRIDEALLAARSATTLEEQKAQYEIVDRWMAEESPWIWLTDGLQATIYGPNVGGGTAPELLRATCFPYVPGLWLNDAAAE